MWFAARRLLEPFRLSMNPDPLQQPEVLAGDWWNDVFGDKLHGLVKAAKGAVVVPRRST